jgi:protein gp37
MAEQRKKTADDGGASNGIAWTEETWNPVMGCSKVSAGCTNCYAEKMAARFSGEGAPFRGLSDGKRWTGEVRFRTDRLAQPLHWTRPRLVFVNSVSDLFHENLPFDQIAAIFGIMAYASRHTFQVLTKRPQRMLDFFAWLEERAQEEHWMACPENAVMAGCRHYHYHCVLRLCATVHGVTIPKPAQDPVWPLPNVWLGVSAEDQDAANARVPLLLRAPAAVRWVSAEPLIGLLDLTNLDDRDPRHPTRAPAYGGYDALRGSAYWAGEVSGWLCYENAPRPDERRSHLDWVVVGGESGPGARQCWDEWLVRIVRDCQDADVPVFVKQLGAAYAGRDLAGKSIKDTGDYEPRRLTHPKGGDVSEWPEALRVRQWPKSYALGEVKP